MKPRSRRRYRRPRNWMKGLVIVCLALAVVGFLYQSNPRFLSKYLGSGTIEDGLQSWRKSLERLRGNDLARAQQRPNGKILIRWSKKGGHRPEAADKAASALPELQREESSRKPPTVSRAFSQGILLVRVDEGRTLTPDGTYLTEQSTGYGFVVRCENDLIYIVTAAHLLRGARPKISATPKGPFLEAEIVSKDDSTDLALLKASASRMPFQALPALPLEPPVSFSDIGGIWLMNAKTRDSLVHGKVLGQPSEAKKLIAKTFGSERAATDWFLVSQPSQRGLSGSPVLSASGRVVGVLIGGLESRDGPDVSIVMGPEALAAILDYVK